MDNKNRLLIIIPIIILIAYLIYTGRRSVSTPISSIKTKTSSLKSAAPKPTKHRRANTKPVQHAVESKISPTVWQEISRCYPRIQQRSSFPLSDVFNQLSEERDYQDIINFENYHITLPNGQERRLQIRLDEDPKGNPLKLLKIFSVDTEGLPVPIKTITSPSEEQISDNIAQGSLHFTQKIGNRFFDENNYISFVSEEGIIQSFEAYLQGHVLKCSMDINEKSHCKCDY